MKHSTGSISCVALCGFLFLAILSQLLLIRCRNDYERTIAYCHSIAQRQLCASVLRWSLQQPEDAFNLVLEHTLNPGSIPASLTLQKEKSADAMFASWKVQSLAGNGKQQRLNYVVFYPSTEIREIAAQHMFSSRYAPTGGEALPDGSLYTSGGSFTMPQLSFLSQRVPSVLDLDFLHGCGFSNSFLYLTKDASITYSSTAKITKGDECLASTGRLTFKEGFHATGRLIILSNSSVVLEDNVTLEKALIIAKGNVTFGAGCRVNGAVLSGSTIKFQGLGTYTHDTSVVANYVSTFFIA